MINIYICSPIEMAAFHLSVKSCVYFNNDSDAVWMILTRNAAARVIQRQWRRFLDVKVFEFYKRLLLCGEKWEQRFLLRCLAPGERFYVDRAAGGFVMFRLGGTTFPPRIFYKLFTYRPIQDVNAYSPKSYVSGNLSSKSNHNKLNSKLRRGPRDLVLAGEYLRVENNEWRPILMDSLFHQSAGVHLEIQSRPVQFHKLWVSNVRLQIKTI
ncbi:unnamed protein product [Dicrocoelium dendriticum]|nr:unnamed protein product [Dicrocoelium dendriticum]